MSFTGGSCTHSIYCLPACWLGCVDTPGLPELDAGEDDELGDLEVYDEVLGELDAELLPVVGDISPVEEGEEGVGSDEGTKKSVIRCCPGLEKRGLFIPSQEGMIFLSPPGIGGG